MIGSRAATGSGTIYVLLPVHDRRPITEAFVRGLLDQTDQGFHLVLIDDGSSDGTGEAVRALLPEATIVRGPGSWWWAGCLQQGQLWLAQQALDPADLVLIANDDTRFDADFLSKARAALAGSSRQMLLAQLYNAETGAFVHVGGRVDWRRLTFKNVSDPARVNCMSTRGLFMSALDFVELGGFHPHLLPHYLSDFAFTIRAFRRGYGFTSDPGVKLWYDPATTGIRTMSRTSVRAYLRSTLTRRSVDDPFYWTTFVLLMSPRRRIPRNLLIVWQRFVRGLRAACGVGSERR